MVGDCVFTSMVGDMVLFSSYFEFFRPGLSMFGFVYDVLFALFLRGLGFSEGRTVLSGQRCAG